MALGLVGGLMIKREMVEYADMEMYASWRKGRYVCRSNKFILRCVNDQRGLTKLTPEQIREMHLSPPDNKKAAQSGRLVYWLAIWLILVPPIIVRVVIMVWDTDGVLAGRG